MQVGEISKNGAFIFTLKAIPNLLFDLKDPFLSTKCVSQIEASLKTPIQILKGALQSVFVTWNFLNKTFRSCFCFRP